MNNSYYFGIEGGGTHSRLAITDKDGKVLARSEAGSTNIYSVSKEEVYDNLSLLLDSALETAGLEKEDLAAGCLGSAGIGRKEEEILLREYFDLLLGPDIKVKLCSDGEILLCGGLENLEGYCLISGTGSIALGRTRRGTLVRAGGLGYMLGDEGSAAWIGKIAIMRVMRSLENRDLATNMLEPILKAAGLSKSSDFIHYMHYDSDKAKVASLAPVVTAAARNGDALALDILHTSAKELALLVKCVVNQSPLISNKELVFTGGVLKHDEIIVNKLHEILKQEFPDLVVSAPKGSALEGACMLAINLGDL